MGSILSVIGGVFGFLTSPAGQALIASTVKEVEDLATLVESLVHHVGTGATAGIQTSTGINVGVLGVPVANVNVNTGAGVAVNP